MPLAIRPYSLPVASTSFAKASALAPYVLSVVRIIVGLLFLEHGTSKYLSFPAAQHTQPLSMSGVGGLLELFGGALIAVGLFTRPVAFLLSGEMAVGYFYSHFQIGRASCRERV